jgi:hypothetical protein
LGNAQAGGADVDNRYDAEGIFAYPRPRDGRLTDRGQAGFSCGPYEGTAGTGYSPKELVCRVAAVVNLAKKTFVQVDICQRTG